MRDIKATRDRLGLSTTELAKLVGVSYRTAHGWIEGRTVPQPVWRLLETCVAHPELIPNINAMGDTLRSNGVDGPFTLIGPQS